MDGMTPEFLLDISTDTGERPLSEKAKAIMAKYSGGGAPPPPKKPPAERVLLSSPAKAHIDAPLTIGEQRAKAIAVGRAIGRVSAALTAAQAAAVAARDRATGAAAAPRKVRSVASARAAREQMEKEALPAALGGLAVEEEPPDEPELTTVDEEPGGDDAEAGAASSSTGPPALCEVWSAKCEELYDDSRVFCVRLSQCGTLLAAGCGDGTVRTFHAGTGRPAHLLDNTAADSDEAADAKVRLPATCLRWRAGRALLVANAAGTVERWQAGATPKRVASLTEEGNQIYAIDCPLDGRQLATAGKDAAVRIYDESRMELVTTLGHPDPDVRRYESASGARNIGHSSRIFSVRFVEADPNRLISGGWDGNVRIWDLRSGNIARTISGPIVCGDAIDVNGNELIIGSYRGQSTHVYDVRTSAPIEAVPWAATRPSGGCKPYCTSFSPTGALLATAGVGALDSVGEVRVFTRSGLRLLGATRVPHGICGLDMADHPTSGTRIAVAGGDEIVRLLSVDTKGGDLS